MVQRRRRKTKYKIQNIQYVDIVENVVVVQYRIVTSVIQVLQ